MSTSASLRGTQQPAAEERRAFPRRSVLDRRLVTVNLDNHDAGLMVDLSEGGMAVQALARIKPGANTSLQFELPDTANRIEARATVVWVDATSGRAGLRFEDLSESAAGSLRKWLWLAAQDRPSPKPALSTGPAAPAAPGSEVRAAEVAALQREISSHGLDRDAALALIADRIRTRVRADGVAIVLGDAKGMTCRASSGSAPPVGTDLLPESGLSGECVRTGVTVRCDDTERDVRVDRDACRAIHLRSAVVVPLFARGNINGLVEVLYAAPCAFDGRDVLTLRRLADLISATLSTSATAEPRQIVQDAVASTGHGSEPSVRPVPAVPVSPPAPRVVSPTNKAACQVCGHPNPLAARSCERCQGPLAGAFSAHPTDPLPWLTVRLNVSPRVLILIALVLLLIGILGWQEYKSRGTHAATPVSWTSSTDTPASH